MVAGDVKCYHCGFISGELIAENADSSKPLLFRPTKGNPRPVSGQGALRCVRCGGPVFVDDVRTVHVRPVGPIPKERRKRRWAKKPLAKAG